jgi:hypothetical protein
MTAAVAAHGHTIERLAHAQRRGPIWGHQHLRGSTKLVLYPQQSLSQDAAVAFCRQQHGGDATLPPVTPHILTAARALVKGNQVGGKRVQQSCYQLLQAWCSLLGQHILGGVSS